MSSFANSTFVRIFICLEIVLFISSAMAENAPDSDPSSKRYCGRALTEVLALICHGEYGAYFTANKRTEGERVGGMHAGGKRAGAADEYLDEYTYSDQPSPLDELPMKYSTYAFLAKLAPESLRSRVRRDGWTTRRGVYDECCAKSCSYNELQAYCQRRI